jgi:hypothetical protein
MKNVLPQSFRVTLTDEKGALGVGLLIRATLRMSQRNDYHVILGPTDDHGQLTVSGSDLENDAKSTYENFPADYVPLADGFSGFVEIHPLSAEQIRSAQDAYNLWRSAISFPQGYRDQLDNGLKALLKWNPHRITATIDDVSPVIQTINLVPSSVSDPVAWPTMTVAI